ncbi:MAG: hypothetical protein JWN25_3189 [Verrucomicrobiales bacterium]|nr:hypothetical protein [Verrucomicrobiales bacterium]
MITSSAWRKDPATFRQIRKLEFFGCELVGLPTKGEACDAIQWCIEHLPEREEEYQKLKMSGGFEDEEPTCDCEPRNDGELYI